MIQHSFSVFIQKKSLQCFHKSSIPQVKLTPRKTGKNSKCDTYKLDRQLLVYVVMDTDPAIISP